MNLVLLRFTKMILRSWGGDNLNHQSWLQVVFQFVKIKPSLKDEMGSASNHTQTLPLSCVCIAFSILFRHGPWPGSFSSNKTGKGASVWTQSGKWHSWGRGQAGLKAGALRGWERDTCSTSLQRTQISQRGVGWDTSEDDSWKDPR